MPKSKCRECDNWIKDTNNCKVFSRWYTLGYCTHFTKKQRSDGKLDPIPYVGSIPLILKKINEIVDKINEMQAPGPSLSKMADQYRLRDVCSCANCRYGQKYLPGSFYEFVFICRKGIYSLDDYVYDDRVTDDQIFRTKVCDLYEPKR